jgi:hypothetical protein
MKNMSGEERITNPGPSSKRRGIITPLHDKEGRPKGVVVAQIPPDADPSITYSHFHGE